MRDAYALVIGIDRYDLDGIPTLPHCVDDALAALAWLRSIEVPDDRILLHVAPSPGRTIDTGGIAVRACDYRSIIRSMNVLAGASADQLFVVLSGHGLYVLSKGSVFLSADYGIDQLKPNLWLEEYLRYFLSWNFARQYVVYNACKEPIATIGQVSPVTPEGPPPPPQNYKAATGNALTVCHAAAPDEKAWVGSDDGTLVTDLLRELAPERLGAMEPGDTMQSAVIYDWDTGARTIDLKEVFDRAVGPAFGLRAKAAGNSQSPFCQRLGLAEVTGRSPIIELTRDSYLPVVVTADPPEAQQAITQLTLRSLEPARELLLPRIDKPISLPMHCLGPVGATVYTAFRADPASSWRKRRSPALTELVGEGVEITLELERMPPALIDHDEPDAAFIPPSPGSTPISGITLDAFNIRANGPAGASYSLPGSAYESVRSGPFAPALPQAGVIFEGSEVGPDIRFDPLVEGSVGAARSHALDWLRALRSTYSAGNLQIHLSPVGDDTDHPATNFRFVLPAGRALRLGGYLVEVPLVTIEPVGFPEGVRRLSLGEIERHPTEYLEAGYYRVKVDLPWGDWACSIGVGLSEGIVECTLPERIGVEPLRNLASFGEVSERAHIREGEAPAATSFNVIVRTETQRVALLGAGIDLIVHRDASGVRVEPRSDTAVPEWDTAFSTGRASAIETRRIRELLRPGAAEAFRTSVERDLMLLACAYTAFGRNDGALAVEALDTIQGVLRESPDAQLLRLATGASDKDDVIRGCADSSLVPLLRWGVPVMQTILDKHGFEVPDWTRHLTFTSAWTTINEEGIETLVVADQKFGRSRVWMLTIDLGMGCAAPVIRSRPTGSSIL